MLTLIESMVAVALPHNTAALAIIIGSFVVKPTVEAEPSPLIMVGASAAAKGVNAPLQINGEGFIIGNGAGVLASRVWRRCRCWRGVWRAGRLLGAVGSQRRCYSCEVGRLQIEHNGFIFNVNS